jgi:putative dehydrogenase
VRKQTVPGLRKRQRCGSRPWKKDIVIAEFAAELGCETPLFTMTQPVYTQAIAIGLGNQHTAAVFEVLKANNAADV